MGELLLAKGWSRRGPCHPLLYPGPTSRTGRAPGDRRSARQELPPRPTIAPDTDPGSYNGWITNGERPWAAVVEADKATAGRWIPYVQVDDFDAAVTTATSLGAAIVTDKTDGPAGTAVTIADPAGALLALWVPHPVRA